MATSGSGSADATVHSRRLTRRSIHRALRGRGGTAHGRSRLPKYCSHVFFYGAFSTSSVLHAFRFNSSSSILVMSINTLPTELLVRVLMQMEPEELSRCDQLSKLFHGPPSLVEQALRLLDSEVGLSGIPETLPNNHANWTQALLFLAILRRGSKHKLVAAGSYHSAFVDEDGTLLICGTSLPGRRSFGGAINQSIPTSVAGLAGVRVHSVVAKYCHIIALCVDGVAFSWGRGGYGVLGHGDNEDVAQPKAIRALSNVCAIDTGASHSLAITPDGTLWSWGRGRANQLGHENSHADELLPRRLEALAGKRICAVAAGACHTLSVCVDGSCFYWGKWSRERAAILQPERIPAFCGERVSSVAASYFVSCAVTWRGDLWRWGHWGQMRLNEPTPLKGTLLDSQRVVSVSMTACLSTGEELHCLALTADGAVFSWVEVNRRNPNGLKLHHHVLGHGDALDAPRSRVSVPRPIEALAGQRICSVATNGHYAIAAGRTVIASVAPATDAGHAQRPQWACWSWGVPDQADWHGLGHGEHHADTSLPRRVVGIGVTPSVTD